MLAAKISPGFQIRIPKAICDNLQINPGDYLEFEIKDGQIVARPKRLVNLDQAWFWTKEWQKKERQADEDIQKERLSGPFNTVEKLKEHLGHND